MNRRSFLANSLTGALASAASVAAATPKFPISLAQYSVHRRIGAQGDAEPLDPLDFPALARSFGIEAVEYSSMLWRETFLEKGEPWLRELAKRAESEGVTNLLIMIDREGILGEKDASARAEAIDAHARYLDAAKALGCRSIRVDPKHTGSSREEALELLATGVRALCQRAAPLELDVLVENEDGFGADADWLLELVAKVDHPRFGLLPDFGNFWLDLSKRRLYDPAEGVRKMMAHARALSAKSFGFEPGSHVTRDPRPGRELALDFDELMKIVVGSGYTGHVGIEYEGQAPEMEGIRQTLNVLQSIAAS